jgi:DNA-binding CsgD family transcriptional regulator
MTIFIEPTQLTLMERAVEVVTGSENAHDLCKKLVHADFSEGQVKGAFIFSIDSRSTLVEFAGYGMPFAEPASEYVLWDDHPLSNCVRTKNVVCDPQTDQTLICLPFIQNGVPAGALVVVCTPEVKETSIGKEALPVLSKLGGYFLHAQNQPAQRTIPTNTHAVSLDEITTRQIGILALMGDGLTNAEIASKVLLSESTVRQETIRIYRALAVGGRLEAVAKARALGLISKIAPPPEISGLALVAPNE